MLDKPEEELFKQQSTQQDRDTAKRLLGTLAQQSCSHRMNRLTVTGADGESTQFDLTPGLTQRLVELLSDFETDDALTSQQTADRLNVSLPFVAELVRNGSLSPVQDGRVQRLSTESVLNYKRKRDATRATALNQLANIDKNLI